MKRGWRNIATWVGAVIVGIAAFCALAAPLLVPHDPFAQDLGRRLLVPFKERNSTLILSATVIDPDVNLRRKPG